MAGALYSNPELRRKDRYPKTRRLEKLEYRNPKDRPDLFFCYLTLFRVSDFVLGIWRIGLNQDLERTRPTATEIELFGVKYKEASLDPKAAEMIKFADLAIGHEHGAKLH